MARGIISFTTQKLALQNHLTWQSKAQHPIVYKSQGRDCKSTHLISSFVTAGIMVTNQMKSAASLLLVLNFCMYGIVLGIGGWAMNRAIDHGFIIGPGYNLPAHFTPIYFPIGNAATGFFVTFALLAGVVGAASAISGLNHIRSWNADSLPSALTAASIAWTLTLLAMGFACKEIELKLRNTRLRTMEAFLIILSATQLLYIIAINGGSSRRTL